MPFPHTVYKKQRIVPMRFKRAITGVPLLTFPDIDDRGWFRAAPAGNNAATNDHGFVVGVTQGKTSFVRVVREKIDNSSPLFVTSSNTATMRVAAATIPPNPAALDALPNTREMLISMTGISGGAGAAPNIARVQIRHGSNSGPIIGELSAWVFRNLTVKLTPHNVAISSATQPAVRSQANISAVIEIVKAFWEPCGVSFTVDPVINTSMTFATPGRVTLPEISALFANTNYVANSINAYFLFQYRGSSDGTLGRGEGRAVATANGRTNPGIILGDANVAGTVRHTDNHWLANDLAHEIGHFFGLEHVDRLQSAAPRIDTWAFRMLMFPSNTYGNQSKAWHNDVGYGLNYRGGLITMKNLTDSANAANHSTDGECAIARTTISSVAGPY